MSNAVVPLSDIARRVPLVGKLKAGVYKSGRPQAIDTWRLTTSSHEFAADFADIYGGTVEPMTNNNSPHKWEVISEASEISIALLGENGYSVQYELWQAGGCQRRCDGVTAEVIQTTGPDDVEYAPTNCICDAKQELECSLKSRLTMILPDLPFRGGVVYETGSKNFAEESQGMLALLAQMQASGVTRGKLRLEQRKSSGNRKYTIAVVGVEQSPEAIVSGMGGVRSLGTAPERPELSSSTGEDAGSGSSRPDPASTSEVGAVAGEGAAPASGDNVKEPAKNLHLPTGNASNVDIDDDIVDAEIIEDEAPQESGEAQEGFVLEPAERARYRSAFMARVKGMDLSYETQVRPWLQTKYGTTGGWSELDDSQAYNLYHALIVPDGSRQEKDDAAERFKAAVQEHAEAAA